MLNIIKQKLKELKDKVLYKIKLYFITENVKNIDAKYSLQLSNETIKDISITLMNNGNLYPESFVFSYLNGSECRSGSIG